MKHSGGDHEAIYPRILEGRRIDFETAKLPWCDENRAEIHASHPVEDRWILIGKIDGKLWAAIYTLRGDAVRIVSVRRSREKEVGLYEGKVFRKE